LLGIAKIIILIKMARRSNIFIFIYLYSSLIIFAFVAELFETGEL